MHVQRQTQLVNPPESEVSDMDVIPHHILTSRSGNVVNLRKFLHDLRAQNDPAIKVSKPLKTIGWFYGYYPYRMTLSAN